MNELTQTVIEKTMTTKEIAEVLGVDISTVQKTVKRINETSDVLPKYSRGQTPVFNEKQATIIKQEIQKHHNLSARQIDTVSTDYEMELMTQKVLNYHIQKANEFKKRAELAEKKCLELQPKAEVYERIGNSAGYKTIGETAKILGVGEKTLFATLRGMGVFFYDNGINQVKQQYINSGYFVMKEQSFSRNGIDQLYSRIFVTAKGLLWLEEKIK